MYFCRIEILLLEKLTIGAPFIKHLKNQLKPCYFNLSNYKLFANFRFYYILEVLGDGWFASLILPFLSNAFSIAFQTHFVAPKRFQFRINFRWKMFLGSTNDTRLHGTLYYLLHFTARRYLHYTWSTNMDAWIPSGYLCLTCLGRSDPFSWE